MYTEIKKCRICGSKNLLNVFSLGKQCLTGYFPSSKNEILEEGPVDLVFCKECGLLQLKQTYNLSEMYGMNYGYRSGLNQSMVTHLSNKITYLENFVNLTENDLVIDIGSNDATSLKVYKASCQKIGIDPTGIKFKDFYPNYIKLIPDFFSEKIFKENVKDKKAKIITSIAMFYDLPDPNQFVKDIAACLEPDGIWHFEQSYMPHMLEKTSYDTICQEHLEFYAFTVIKNLLEKNKLRIIDVEFNFINGGSFAITAAHESSSFISNEKKINEILENEINLKLMEAATYINWGNKVIKNREELINLLLKLKADNKKVFGYGASTKGNVILQYCNITTELLPCIMEVNKDKFGCYTPGSQIPIISEEEAKKLNPDYFLVLPWHFKNFILSKEIEFRKNGVKFIFPLPAIEII